MSSITIDVEVRSYLAAVVAQLDDLPPDEREELTDDLEQHLFEVAAEGEGSLQDRLGPPEEYAAELRASAGFPPPGGSGSRFRNARRAVDSIRTSAVVRTVLQSWPQFRPAWWVIRGYMFVIGFDVLFTDRLYEPAPILIPNFRGTTVFGWASIVIVVVASVMLGRRAERDRAARWMDVISSIVVLVMSMATLSAVGNSVTNVEYVSDVVPHLHHEDGAPITNICAYTPDMKQLDDVLLFDQDGRPIDNVLDEHGYSVRPVPGELPERGFSNSYPRPMIDVDEAAGTESPFKCPTAAKAETAKKSSVVGRGEIPTPVFER